MFCNDLFYNIQHINEHNTERSKTRKGWSVMEYYHHEINIKRFRINYLRVLKRLARAGVKYK